MKNLLFLGLGSIGQRHFRNLKKIDKRLNFFCIRKKNIAPFLDNQNKVKDKKINLTKIGIKEITFKDIKKCKIDTAFVTNPTSLHVKNAIKLANLNLDLFIEKPLSHNLDGVKDLKKLIKKKKLKCEIGFQTRYDEILLKIKKIIDSRKYGKILKCDIAHCHYLPFHHKYENYKISYASRKNLGGGVLLCFSHEVDYAQYLFGNPKKIIPIKISSEKNLNINVETSAEFSMIYKNNLKVDFNLDFLKKKPVRICNIQFEKGNLKWDLLQNKLTIKTNFLRKFKNKKRKRNELFLKSIKYVKKNFSKNKNGKNTIENGIKNLHTILKIKKSLNLKKIIKLHY